MAILKRIEDMIIIPFVVLSRECHSSGPVSMTTTHEQRAGRIAKQTSTEVQESKDRTASFGFFQAH